MARSIWLPLASSVAVLSNAAFALWLGAAAAIAQDGNRKDGAQPPPRRTAVALEDAFRRVQKLSSADTMVLAAQGTPEGHWRFVSKSGEMFTVGTPDEMKRVVTVLYPEAKADAPLALYMTEDTLLGKGVRFRVLPAGAERHIVVGEKSYRLLPATGEPRYAQVNPKSSNVWVEVRDNPLLKEALGRLAEPLGKAGVRLLALEPGGPKTLPRDPAHPGKAAQGERIDPAGLATALAGLPAGQTLVVCAGGEDDRIYLRPTDGPEGSLPVGELIAAAEGADVALIVLQFSPALQTPAAGAVACPDGGRLAPELTLADILDAAVVKSRQAPVAVALAGRREALDATVVGEPASGAQVRLGDARRSGLGRGFLADLQVSLPALYLAMLMLGWLGTPVARDWWAKAWSAGDPAEYPGHAGYWAARAVGFLAFALVFQPVTGVATALVNLGPQIWAVIRPAIWGLFVVLRWITGLGGGGKLEKKQTSRQSA
jgi:hypothetical protein